MAGLHAPAPRDAELSRFFEKSATHRGTYLGISAGAWLHDTTSQRNIDFHRVRHLAPYRYCETSWQEQRDYLEYAIEGLRGTDLQAEARQALAHLTPTPPDLRGWTSCAEAPTGHTERLQATFDATGAIATLVDLASGQDLLATEGCLGLLRYQTFSTEDGVRYTSQYNGTQARRGAEAGFVHAGLRPEDAESGMWPARLLSAWTRICPAQCEVLCEVTFDSRTHVDYGAPARAFLHYTFPTDARSIAISLQWFDKTVTRLPEAIWLSFQPEAPEPRGWKMRKMGRWIPPLKVVSRGNRKLHATAGDVRYDDGARLVSIHSLDAPLVAPGQPSLMVFDDQFPDLTGGMHFNLLNNIWTTNFPLWYGDDARFRFRIA